MNAPLCIAVFGLAWALAACSYEDVQSNRFKKYSDHVSNPTGEEEDISNKEKNSSAGTHSGEKWEFFANMSDEKIYHYINFKGQVLRFLSFANNGRTDADDVEISETKDGKTFESFHAFQLPLSSENGDKFYDAVSVFKDEIFLVYQKIEGDILQGDNDDKFFMLKSNDGKNWEKSIDPFEGTGCGLSASRKISVGFESGGAIFFNCAGLTDSITIKSVDGVKWSELQSVLNPIELKYAGSEWRLTEDKRLEARSSPTVDWKGVDLKAPLTDELDASNEEDAYTVLYDLLYVVDSAMYAKVKIKESYFAEPEFQLWKSIP